MNENRMKILNMLAQGQITADEAERLIAALETGSSTGSAAGAAESAPPKAKPKYLRVVATDTKQNGDPVNVNVRVPLGMLRAGVKLTGLIPKQARDRVNAAMQRDGVPFDLNQITAENLEDVIVQLDELTVDVDDMGKTKVRVYCE
jgi:hypothetical protein